MLPANLLSRWYLRLAPLLPKMKLQYKLGTANKFADALSRAPLPNCPDEENKVLQVSQLELEPSQVALGRVQQ